MPKNFEPSHSWGFPACGKKVQISLDGNRVMAGSPHYAKSEKYTFNSGKIEGWEYNKYSQEWIKGKAPLVGYIGQLIGQDFSLDYAGSRAAVCGSGPGGQIFIIDFNGSGWFEVIPGITFKGYTGSSGIHLSSGNLIAVADPAANNGRGLIRFYDFTLTQIIIGNVLAGEYIAANSFRVGSNDSTTNDNIPKRISFGGTYQDNEYNLTTIENRSFYYNELNSDADLNGNSELIFSKNSNGDMADMIRMKSNEFRIDNNLQGD